MTPRRRPQSPTRRAASRTTTAVLAFAAVLIALITACTRAGADGKAAPSTTGPAVATTDEPMPDEPTDLDGAAPPRSTSSSPDDTLRPCVDEWLRCGGTMQGDVDGDGRIDTITLLTSTFDPRDVDADPALGIEVDFGEGRTSTTTVGALWNSFAPIGVVDLDGDGDAEVLTVSTTGAHFMTYDVHTWDGAALRFVDNLPFDGAAYSLAGLTCTDTDGDGVRELVVPEASAYEGDLNGARRATASWTTYRLTGADLVEVDHRVEHFTVPADTFLSDLPSMSAVGGFHCPGLTEWTW